MEQNQAVIETTVEELEAHIKDTKVILELVNGDAWKRIIDKLYFEEEAIRLVNATGNLALTADQKANVVGMMAGIPALKNFVNRVISTGAQAKQDLADYEAENSAGEETD